MRKQGYMAQSKEPNTFPDTNPKEIEVCDLPDKVLKTTTKDGCKDAPLNQNNDA